MYGEFFAWKTIFNTFIQDILSRSINLLLALYKVFQLFYMGPEFMFRRVCGDSEDQGTLDAEPPDSWDSGGLSLSDEVPKPNGHELDSHTS